MQFISQLLAELGIEVILIRAERMQTDDLWKTLAVSLLGRPELAIHTARLGRIVIQDCVHKYWEVTITLFVPKLAQYIFDVLSIRRKNFLFDYKFLKPILGSFKFFCFT